MVNSKSALWILIFCVSAVAHFAASAMQLDWVAVPAKLIPMACLIALLPVWSSRRDLYQRAIMAGFIFSGIGDYFMARTDGFILGLSSFLVAHLCYITAFSSGGARLHPLRLIPFVAVGVGIMSVLWPNLGDLKIPVLFYVGAILTMGWRAAARVGHEGDLLRMQWAGLLGAASFILSDSLIAFDKFHQAIPAAHLWIMLTYWAGQIGIACSVRRNDIQF